MAPQNFTGASVNNIEANSSGPYTPAKEKDGRVIREETYEQVYRISGTGRAPNFDPNDMVSLPCTPKHPHTNMSLHLVSAIYRGQMYSRYR